MTSDEIAEYIPLLHGDAIRSLDVRRFLVALNESRGLRESCRNLGYLVTDLAESTRKERFLDCLSLLLCWTQPPTQDAVVCHVVLDPGFVTAARAFQPGMWRSHTVVARSQDRPGKVSSISVSAELADRIRALQDFWGLRNYAVK